ncbi:MAG: four helix bundle protein [Burkholderiales bacterium]
MASERRGPELALRTKNFALEAISAYTQLPKTTLHQILGRQLLRSATSVGAQYRESDAGEIDSGFLEQDRRNVARTLGDPVLA